MSEIFAQVIVSAIVVFIGAGLGIMVTVQVMKHRIEWLKEVLEKDAILHGRIDGLNARLAAPLGDHVYGRFRE